MAAVGDSDLRPGVVKGIFAEPSLVELSNGTLLMSMRVNAALPGREGCKNCRAAAISTDGGATFGAPWFPNQYWSGGDDQGALLRGVGKPGILHLSTRVYWKNFPGTAAVLTSFDDGTTFPQEQAVPVFQGSMKYSALAYLPGDGGGPEGGLNTTHVAMLYERGPPDEYAHVGLAIVPVPSQKTESGDGGRGNGGSFSAPAEAPPGIAAHKSDDDDDDADADAAGDDPSYILAAQGQSCEVACGLVGRDCSQHIDTGNTTDRFAGLGVHCRTATDNSGPRRGSSACNATWNARDQPSFVSEPTDLRHGCCQGFVDTPKVLSCQPSPETNTRRLCHCGAPNDAQYHFGTGFTGGELMKDQHGARWRWWENETFFFAHRVEAGSTGVMTHMWATVTPECEPDFVMRYYVDGERNASIEFTPAMAAGVGFDQHGPGSDGAPWNTKWMGLGVGGAANRYNKTGQAWRSSIRIPFQSTIQVSVQHKSDCTNPDGFFFILRGAKDLPLNIGGYALPKTSRLQLQAIDTQVAPLDIVNLTHVPDGNSGLLFMVTMAVEGSSLSFLEGCVHSYSPPDQAFPGTVLSTGTEVSAMLSLCLCLTAARC
eukprot:SAG22_NODE_1239_length_5047_cov_3.281326_4_plen_598_part_00